MVKESEIYDAMKEQIGNAVDLQRHEDRYSRGIPDVSFGVKGINGWVELKRREKWPADPQAPVLLKHFTPHQKNWLRRRQKFGGNTWFLLQVDCDYLIFKGDACDNVGTSYMKDQMFEHAYSSCCGKGNVGVWLYQVITEGIS